MCMTTSAWLTRSGYTSGPEFGVRACPGHEHALAGDMDDPKYLVGGRLLRRKSLPS
jgi:hypothetical protein